MSAYNVTMVRLHGPMVFTLVGYSAPIAPDVNGVITLDLAQGGAFLIAAGSVIKGIRYLNRPDLEVRPADNSAEMCMLMLQAEDGGSMTIAHESLDVTEQTERIDVSDGAATAIDSKRVQVFYEPWRSGGRTRVHDWAGV